MAKVKTEGKAMVRSRVMFMKYLCKGVSEALPFECLRGCCADRADVGDGLVGDRVAVGKVLQVVHAWLYRVHVGVHL